MESEQELMRWAGQKLRATWERTTEVARRMLQGEALSEQDATIDLVLTPYRIDYRVAAGIFSDLMPRLLGGCTNLFTAILDEAGARLLRTYVEQYRAGHYVSMVPVPMEDSTARQFLSLLRARREEELLALTKQACRQQGCVEPDWIKAATLPFFQHFRILLDESERQANQAYFLLRVLEASARAFREKWLQFLPEAPVVRFLREFACGVWHGSVSELDAIFRFFEKRETLPGPDTLVALQGRREASLFRFGERAPRHLTVDFATAQGARSIPFSRLAGWLRAEAEAGQALAIRLEDWLPLLDELLKAGWPLPRELRARLLRMTLDRLARPGVSWELAPRPFYLNPLGRRLFRLLWNVCCLPRWKTPGFSFTLLTEWRDLFAGTESLGVLLLAEDRPIAALLFEFPTGGHLRTFTAPVEPDVLQRHSSDPLLALRALFDRQGRTVDAALQLPLESLLQLYRALSPPRRDAGWLPWTRMFRLIRWLRSGSWVVEPELEWGRLWRLAGRMVWFRKWQGEARGGAR